MQKNKFTILSTRPLSEHILKEASSNSIHIECISFIETDSIIDEGLQNEILSLSQKKITAVFTSMNAVEAVVKFIDKKIDWKVYSLGNTTKELINKKLKIAPIGEADNAADLANAIINDKEKEVYFFCGDIRRDELPDKLNAAGIKINEVVVYRTIKKPIAVEKNFDAVLFYSPSAVESFFSMNVIDSKTVLFAIGNTTASTIEKFSNNKIIVSETTGKEDLVKKMISYFSNQTIPTHE